MWPKPRSWSPCGSPTRMDEDGGSDGPDGAPEGEPENLDPDKGKSQQQVIDEMTGQLELFPDNQ